MGVLILKSMRRKSKSILCKRKSRMRDIGVLWQRRVKREKNIEQECEKRGRSRGRDVKQMQRNPLRRSYPPLGRSLFLVPLRVPEKLVCREVDAFRHAKIGLLTPQWRKAFQRNLLFRRSEVMKKLEIYFNFVIRRVTPTPKRVTPKAPVSPVTPSVSVVEKEVKFLFLECLEEFWYLIYITQHSIRLCALYVE
jgi:hypothetical protein